MTLGHNLRERQLITDLNRKNFLSRNLRQISADLERWRQRMKTRRSKRWLVQYGSSCKRASARLEDLRSQVLARAEALKARIVEEQSVSKDEVASFEKQLRKEVKELEAARVKLEELRQDVEKAESDPASLGSDTEKRAQILIELQRKHRRAERKVRSESKDVDRVESEISSEENDKAMLSRELNRAIEEIETLQS